MSRTPARSNRQLVRQARVDAVKANWLILFAFAVFIGLLCVAVAHLPGSTEWHGFLLGVFVTVGAVGELTAVHLASGTHHRALGVFGETATAAAVCGRWHHLRGWRHIGGLYFQRHGDVDHAVVGPRGIYAIETKWTTGEWKIIDSHLIGDHTEGVLAQARDSADRLRKVLNLGRERLGVEVRPVVFVWGPGAPIIPGGFVDIDGVRVVEGRWGRIRHKQIFDDPPLPRNKRQAATQLLIKLSSSQQSENG